jgi:DNA-binding transcriptional LysR family regulator
LSSFRLFASKGYVEAAGLLTDFGDIAQHVFLQYDTHEIQRWSAPLMQQVRSLDRLKLRTSSIAIYLTAMRANMGIGILPTFYRHLTDLVEMPIDLPDRGELWIVSHEETNGSRRTRLLLDFLRSDFRENGRLIFS